MTCSGGQKFSERQNDLRKGRRGMEDAFMEETPSRKAGQVRWARLGHSGFG